MQVHDIPRTAADAVPARPERPATVLVHDSEDLRLVVFRIEPGQEVARHTNAATVMLTVIEGVGIVSGADGERTVGPGSIVHYQPREPHGMRATDQRFILLATIALRRFEQQGGAREAPAVLAASSS